MLDRNSGTGPGGLLEFLEGGGKSRPHGKSGVWHVDRSLTGSDVDMQKLQMTGKRPRCRQGRLQQRLIRLAATDRNKN